MIYDSVLETVGNTPIVRLKGFVGDRPGTILCKLEYLSPGLSKKDRVAIRMIEDAERSGKLSKGQPVVEVTSGNMGIGLAIACRLKGYPFVAVISRGNSVERVKMMRAFGAEIVMVDQDPGAQKGKISRRDIELVELAAEEMVARLGAYRADQFANPSNPEVWSTDVAAEIATQLDGPVDAFADFMGTGGCFWGLSAALKRLYPSIRCYGVEPYEAPYYTKTSESLRGTHSLQGGGYSRAIRFFDEDYGKTVDGFVRVTDDEAVEAARELAAKDCVFGGFSSGANAAAAMKLLGSELAGKTVLIVAPDSGTKYLSTSLWDLPEGGSADG